MIPLLSPRLPFCFGIPGLLILISSSLFAQLQWEPAGLAGLEVKGVLYDSTSSCLLAGSTQGIHRSTDRGSTWTLVQAEPASISYWNLAGDGHGNVYGGNGTYSFARSTDGGVSWNVMQASQVQSLFQMVGPVGTDAAGNVFVGTNMNVWRSSDHGSTWVRKNNGLPSGYPDVQAFARNPRGSFFCATGGIVGSHIYRTTNNGDQWALSREGTMNNGIYTMTATSGGAVIAYAWQLGILRSTDDGTSWQTIELMLRDNDRVAAVVAARDTVYLMAVARHESDVSGKLHVSRDQGSTWNADVAALLPVDVNDLTAIPGVALFAATDDGVYRLSLTPASAPRSSTAEEPRLAAWPVPAGDHLNVVVSDATSLRVELVDALGRVVVRATGALSRAKLDVSSLPVGRYTLHAASNGRSISQGIIVTR